LRDSFHARGNENGPTTWRELVERLLERPDFRAGFSDAQRIEFAVVETPQCLDVGCGQFAVFGLPSVVSCIERDTEYIGFRTVDRTRTACAGQPKPSFMQSFGG
jgi:hypothetical protein